jgi:hypothetical protein
MTEPAGPFVEDQPQGWDGPTIPVHIASWGAARAEEVSADRVGLVTWTLQQAGQVAQVPLAPILQRRYRRDKAYILILSLGGSTQIIFNNRSDSLTGPNPQGLVIPVAGLTLPFILPEWENVQPLYAVSAGGQAVVGIIDHAYAEPEQAAG